MKLGGDAKRIELFPETDEDKAVVEAILRREQVIRAVLNESHPLIYWGDSDEFNGALIINSHIEERAGNTSTFRGRTSEH